MIMFKVTHNLCPSYIRSLFSFVDSTHNLRNEGFLIPYYQTVTHGKYSLRYLGTMLWIKLDSEIKTLTSSADLKRSIKKLDLSKYVSAEFKDCIFCRIDCQMFKGLSV